MNSGSLCIFLGMWLFFSGFVNELYNPLNLTISGLIAISISLYGFLIRKKKRALTVGIIGIWLLFNGLILENIAPYNFILFGFIIAFLGTSCICRKIESDPETNEPFKKQLRKCFKFSKN